MNIKIKCHNLQAWRIPLRANTFDILNALRKAVTTSKLGESL